jgi:hypothetical protein
VADGSRNAGKIMENQTSFDLNRAIRDWRQNLEPSPALRGQDLDELESHLRDSTATLQATGLSAEESFLVAVRRIGQPTVLETEFGKINAPHVWLDRVLWMLIGFQFWNFVWGLISTTARGAVLFGMNLAPDRFAVGGHAVPVALLTITQLAAFSGTLALCWWWIRKRAPRIGSWAGTFLRGRKRFILTFGVVCLALWSAHAVNFIAMPLLMKVSTMPTFGDLMLSQYISNLISFPMQTAAFVALTLFLARKRLRAATA